MTGNLEQYATSYDWGLRIHSEGINTTTNVAPNTPATADDESAIPKQLKVSDAIWVMVIQDGEVIICSKADVDAKGNVIPSRLPTNEMVVDQILAKWK